MAASKKQKDTSAYDALNAALKNGVLKNLYVFHGEERYLLERTLETIRKMLVSGDAAAFNHRRLNGAGLTIDTLEAAVDTLPAFAERTLVEVSDYDLFKAGEQDKVRLIGLISDLPDYVCLIFVYDVMEFKLDGRLKLTAALKEHAELVEFHLQEQGRLVKWIGKHCADGGKSIDTSTAEYLAFVTGGLMTALNEEIEKLCFYTEGRSITRADIDAIVSPALDAVSYQLTDAVVSGDFNRAASVMTDLLTMREAPHKLMYSIAMRLRQLLAARVSLDNALGTKEFMSIAGIKFEFQARGLLSAARRVGLAECARFVSLSAETALRLNSGGSGEAAAQLTDLLIRLSACRENVRAC